MSSGSTQPIGSVCIICPTTFMSSGPGFSRSGRNSFMVPSFMNSGVFTLVGCTELTRMFCCAEFDREGPHQADDAVFGGHVVTAVRVGLQTADRAGQNDRPAATALKEMRHTGFHRLPHAAEVDVDHVRPVFLAGLVQRCAAVADAGVGDDDVEPAQLLDAGVDGGLRARRKSRTSTSAV